MARMAKIFKGDKNYNALKSYLDANRCKLDVTGVIGESCAKKTHDYITWYSTPEEALFIAKKIILDPKRYNGHIEKHEYIPNKIVAIYDGHASVYVKCMVSGGILWIDVHQHDLDKY